MTLRRTTALRGVGLLALAMAGCSTTGPFGREKLAIHAGTQYVGGRGYAMYPTTEDIVENVKATLTAMGMHSIHPIPEPSGTLGFEATTADRRAARVTLQTTGIRTTVGMKVGWVGDEPLTRSFLDQLQERQGALPASALPDEPDPEEAPRRLSRTAVPDSIMIRNQLDPTNNPTAVGPN